MIQKTLALRRAFGFHVTTSLSSHLVCMTPGRFGPIIRAGNPCSRWSGSPLTSRATRVSCVGGVQAVQLRLAEQAARLEGLRRHLSLSGGAGEAQQVVEGDPLPPGRGAPPLDAGDGERDLTLIHGPQFGQ